MTDDRKPLAAKQRPLEVMKLLEAACALVVGKLFCAAPGDQMSTASGRQLAATRIFLPMHNYLHSCSLHFIVLASARQISFAQSHNTGAPR